MVRVKKKRSLFTTILSIIGPGVRPSTKSQKKTSVSTVGKETRESIDTDKNNKNGEEELDGKEKDRVPKKKRRALPLKDRRSPKSQKQSMGFSAK